MRLTVQDLRAQWNSMASPPPQQNLLSSHMPQGLAAQSSGSGKPDPYHNAAAYPTLLLGRPENALLLHNGSTTHYAFFALRPSRLLAVLWVAVLADQNH